eukprot:6184424-Pleurochrysis_carterae.AAC.1
MSTFSSFSLACASCSRECAACTCMWRGASRCGAAGEDHSSFCCKDCQAKMQVGIAGRASCQGAEL